MANLDVAIRDDQVTFVVVEEPIVFNVVEEVVQFAIAEEALHFELFEETIVFPQVKENVFFDVKEDAISFFVTEAVVLGIDAKGTEHRTDVTVKVGQPVYFDPAGRVLLGLDKQIDAIALGSATPGQKVAVMTQGIVNISNWIYATGTKYLTIGAVYYLDQNGSGKLTTRVTSKQGRYILKIGTAISPTELDIDIESAIRL